MMLFICQYCGEDYKIELFTNTVYMPAQTIQDSHYPHEIPASQIPVIRISYRYQPTTTDSRGRQHSEQIINVTNVFDPCENCRLASEKAKADKLAEIKKEHGRVEEGL